MSIKRKWIDFLYASATGSRKVRNFFTPIGAIFYGFLIALFIVVALKVDMVFGFTIMLPRPFLLILSLPLLVISLFLIGWSVANFIRVKGTPVPINPPPKLVVTGPYAYTRNPMLTGIFTLLFGFGVLFESVSLLIIFTPFFIFINVWQLKAIEEPELVKRLGQDYIAYRNETPMFFPRLRELCKKRKYGDGDFS